MSTSATPGAGNPIRLPVVAVLALLALGALSVFFGFGPGIVWLLFLVFNLGVLWFSYRSVVRAVQAQYRLHQTGQLDRPAARAEALKTIAVPVWYLATLVVAALPALFWLLHVVGTLIFIAFVVVLAGVLALGAWLAYKAAKQRGLL